MSLGWLAIVKGLTALLSLARLLAHLPNFQFPESTLTDRFAALIRALGGEGGTAGTQVVFIESRAEDKAFVVNTATALWALLGLSEEVPQPTRRCSSLPELIVEANSRGYANLGWALEQLVPLKPAVRTSCSGSDIDTDARAQAAAQRCMRLLVRIYLFGDDAGAQ